MGTFLRILIPAGVVVAAYVLLASSTAPGPAASAPPPVWGVAELGPGRHWGREAFIPDWQAARRIDHEAARHFLQHWLPRLRAGEPPPATASGAAQAGAARLFATDYWTAILPSQAPPAAALPQRLTLAAAQGESEPLAFGVANPGEALAVRIRVSDLENGNARIAAEHVTLHLMLPYAPRADADDEAAGARRPMVLLPLADSPWRVPAQENRVFVVDVHVPRGAVPGRYEARLSVQIGAATHTRVLALEVLPFTLKVNGFHAGAFGTTYDQWPMGFTGYYPEMIEMDSRYGFNIAGGFFNKGNELPFREDAGGALVIDTADPRFAVFDRTMQRLAAHGMGDVLFWNWGASGKVEQFDNVLRAAGSGGGIHTDTGKLGFAQILRAIKQAERRHGWPEMVINPYDEALKDQDATREIIEAIPLVDRLSPATRLYMTEWRPGYAAHYQSSGAHLAGQGRPREAEWEALVAAGERLRLNFEVIGSNVLHDASRRLQDTLGGEYWHYTTATRLRAESRFAFGFEPWIQRSEAVLMWANYKGSLHGEGWTLHYVMPLDPQGREHRDTRGPVIPSVRALAVREGIDDRKYIETLRYHAWRLDSQADLELLVDLARRARRLLLNAREIGGLENVEARMGAGGEALEAMRAEVRDRLRRLLARQNPATPES